MFKFCAVVPLHVANDCCCGWWCHVYDGFAAGFAVPNTVHMGGGLSKLHEPS